MLSHRVSRVGVALICGLASLQSAFGEEDSPLCRFVVHQERVEHEEIAIELEISRSQLAAAEKIFELLDSLWQREAVERIRYLAAKHDRDQAKHITERIRLILERQETVIEQYRLLCAGLERDRRTEEQNRALEKAYGRYRSTDCRIREEDTAIAEIDLAYSREVLKSVEELREKDVATAQDVIVAQRDVKMAEIRLEQSVQRAEACKKELAGAASR